MLTHSNDLIKSSKPLLCGLAGLLTGLQRALKTLGNERYLHAGGRVQHTVSKPRC